MTDDTRRAACVVELRVEGRPSRPPFDADALVDDDGLTAGDIRLAWLDADRLEVGDHRLTVGLWPGGTLLLSRLARRFDAFSEALAAARDRGRVVGFLAHAPAPPTTYSGAVLRGSGRVAARILLYPTHVTVVPDGEDPFQVPIGALSGIEALEDPPAVVLRTARGETVVGQLARRRDAFMAAVGKARDTQATRWADYAGQGGFGDGVALARARVKDFDGLLARCCAPERIEGARWLVDGARGGDARLGFAALLDPDPQDLRAPSVLPENSASFLLVPAGRLVVFEILSGPAAATYVFAAPIDQVGDDLQALHLRRGALALTDAQARRLEDNPYRLALRRLGPLQRLRAATTARVVHADGWREAMAAALAGG